MFFNTLLSSTSWFIRILEDISYIKLK
jgi:hypothetical protein